MLSFLRVFVPSNARLADGTQLAAPPKHFSCRGDYLHLTVGRHDMTLLANTSRVSRGDRQEIIAASGKKMVRTFDQDGLVVDFAIPPELLSIVRRAAFLRPRIGVALAFKNLPHFGGDSLTEPDAREFTGAELTFGPNVDRAARFELIEL